MISHGREEARGRNLAVPGSFFTRHMASGTAQTLLTGVDQVTGEERMMALQTIRPENLKLDKPLVVAAGRGLSAIYAPWRSHAWEDGIFFLAMAALSALLLVVYQTRARRADRELAAAMEKLKESEARVRSQLREIEEIFRCSPVGLFIFDREYRFLRINERMAEINGFPVEYHSGRTLDEIVPDLADYLKKAYQPIFERGEPVLNVEIHGRTPKEPDRPRDWIGNYYPLRSDLGEVVGLIGAVLEITERKQLENELKRSQATFSTIFRNSPEIIAITEKETGRFLEVNDAFERIMGFAKDEVIGRTSLELGTWCSKDQRERLREALGTATRLANYLGRFRRKSGECFPALISLEVVDFDGTECFILCARDISDRERAETELREAKVAAEAASRAKSAFLANMSHEIRTPLNGVLGMTQLLEMKELSSEQRECVEAILLSGNTLLSVLNDILDFSRIEAERVELESIGFSLRECINGLTRILQAQVSGKGLALKVDLPDDVPDALVGDQVRLKRVLLNLLGNAVKFTERGGNCSLGCRGGAPGVRGSAGHSRAGYRHRHSRRDPRTDLQPVRPGGQFHYPPFRRDRPGALHLPPARGNDGGDDPRGEQGRGRQHLCPPDSFSSGSPPGGGRTGWRGGRPLRAANGLFLYRSLTAPDALKRHGNPWRFFVGTGVGACSISAYSVSGIS